MAQRLLFQASLRSHREGRGETQRGLAAAIGCSSALVWKLERSPDANPELDTLIKISNHFGISIGELLGETEQPTFGPSSWQSRCLQVFAPLDPEQREAFMRIASWVGTPNADAHAETNEGSRLTEAAEVVV